MFVGKNIRSKFWIIFKFERLMFGMDERFPNPNREHDLLPDRNFVGVMLGVEMAFPHRLIVVEGLD